MTIAKKKSVVKEQKEILSLWSDYYKLLYPKKEMTQDFEYAADTTCMPFLKEQDRDLLDR